MTARPSAAEARALWERHAFLLLAGLPRGAHLALDAHAYVVDTQFQGFKMVPPGLHCLTWQAGAWDGDRHDVLAAEGMRSVLFLYTAAHEVFVRTYEAATDTWAVPPGTDARTPAAVSQEHLQALDAQLAPYPMDGASWAALTHWLAQSPRTLERVFRTHEHAGDATCDSFTPVAPADTLATVRELRAQRLPDTPSGLAFTPVCLAHSWPPDAQGAERTLWSMDKSWRLAQVLAQASDAEGAERNDAGPLLREAELCFLLVQCANHAGALEHWLALVDLFCYAGARLGAPAPHALHPAEWDVAAPAACTLDVQLDAHVAWMHTFTAQCEALPTTVWTDELAPYEARVLQALAQLRAHMARALGAWAARHERPVGPTPPHERLVQAWRTLSAAVHTRFGWALDARLDEEVEVDDDDDAPVVVDM
ncbi:hypothetical protein MCAP1_002319 [Malassezia caprae]|uniref:Uncharacterized protein n=1 Tax=Malassezia caprae TaxID=1381934 RepID=A0AAF0E941_9BASI|nr:hypothetical protein MCAP1_002319 [Malassezia caprae]